MKPIYTITGTVVHGRGIGKHVGTPTANIETGEYTALPETGVYVSEILLDNRTYYGSKLISSSLITTYTGAL